MAKKKIRGSDWKKAEVEDIKKLTTSYPTIAIINLEDLPAKQLQSIRRKLKKDITIKISKKRIIKRAFEGVPNTKIKELFDYLTGSPALIFSKLGAFELFKILKESRMSAPAKPGQIAPNDIWVSAGPTPFAPGPVISELSQLKIKSSVEGGKIVIKLDTLVVKKGERVSPTAASILGRLGIEPMEIGVNVAVVLEGTDIYTSEVLDIDVDRYVEDLKAAHTDCLKLAIERTILNTDSVPLIISKVYKESKALALAQGILTSETTAPILQKAESQAKALGGLIK